MKKFSVDVKESQVIEGVKTFTTSSHLVEAESAWEARTIFSAKLFPNERIVDVYEQTPINKKVVK
jgi:hypothetical protein